MRKVTKDNLEEVERISGTGNGIRNRLEPQQLCNLESKEKAGYSEFPGVAYHIIKKSLYDTLFSICYNMISYMSNILLLHII